jgi:hypothetical protein
MTADTGISGIESDVVDSPAKQAIRHVGRQCDLEIRLNGLNSSDDVTQDSSSSSRHTPLDSSSRRVRR